MAYVLVVITVAAIAGGQLLFKMTAERLAGRPFGEAVSEPATVVPFLLALVLYGSSTILWILALRDLPLSRAYVFMAGSFVIVPLCAMMVFGEKLSLSYVVGVGLIVAGILVTQVFD